MKSLWLGGLLAIAACGFDSGVLAGGGDGGSTGGDGGPGIDADPNAPDGAPDLLCGYSFEPAHFDACDDPQPTVSVSINGNQTYDTDNATFTPNPSAATSLIGGVRVVWTTDFTVNGILRVEGSRPVLFVANGSIDISGTIDVSSRYDGTSYDLGAGASSVHTACANPPQAGLKCANHGASGGGGGGFGTGGGGGDRGAEDRDCGGGRDGSPATSGGQALESPPTTIRAGCAGAPGDWSEGSAGDEGFGGPAGGAVHLTARLGLTISGTVNAGGGAGGGAKANRASGGGAGSGGYIGIESRIVTVTDTAVLAANGGGGGGGCENSAASTGENGKADLDIAAGGPKEGNGGDGNDGAINGTGPEAPGNDPDVDDRGGGGGGGGLGFILFHLPGTSTIAPGATITPGGTQI